MIESFWAAGRHTSDHAAVRTHVTAHFTARGRIGTCWLGRMNGFACGSSAQVFCHEHGVKRVRRGCGLTNRAARGKREQVRDRVRDAHSFSNGSHSFQPQRNLWNVFRGAMRFILSLAASVFQKRLRECGRNSVRIDATWIKQSLGPANPAALGPEPVDLDQRCTKQKEILWFYNWYFHFAHLKIKGFFFFHKAATWDRSRRMISP